MIPGAPLMSIRNADGVAFVACVMCRVLDISL